MLKPNYEADPTAHPEAFQDALVAWYRTEARCDPWRQTSDPYAILVSEVMLQQTTIQSVLENQRYERFLEEFPTVSALSQAEESDILRAWEGLGYYNRVRNLQKAARVVEECFDGVFPSTLDALEALPGVGRYTAAAVYSFAYGKSAPLVDANVQRLFARLFNDQQAINTPSGIKAAWQKAAELVPVQNAREYNGALMELGQRVCRQKEVRCLECPVASFCRSSDPLSLPHKVSRAQRVAITECALWVRRGDSLLLEQERGKRRRGFWRLPLIAPEEVGCMPTLYSTKYGITKYDVTLKVFAAQRPARAGSAEWISLARLADLPIVSPVRKVISALLEN